MPDEDHKLTEVSLILNVYRVFREQWVDEDRLINQRLTWLFISQSILLSVFAAWLTNSPKPDMNLYVCDGPQHCSYSVDSLDATADQTDAGIRAALPFIFALTAALICLFVWASITGAQIQMRRLATLWANKMTAYRNNGLITQETDTDFPLGSGPSAMNWGDTAPNLIPPLLFTVWLYLMLFLVVKPGACILGCSVAFILAAMGFGLILCAHHKKTKAAE